MTLKFSPDQEGNPIYIQNGMRMKSVFLPPRQVSKKIYSQLELFHNNLRIATFIDDDNETIIEQTRRLVSPNDTEQTTYLPGKRWRLNHENFPEEGYHVLYEQKWGRLTHESRSDQFRHHPLPLVLTSYTRNTSSEAPLSSHTQHVQQQNEDEDIPPIRKTIDAWAKIFWNNGDASSKREARKIAINEFEDRYDIRVPLLQRLRRRTFLYGFLGVAATIAAGDGLNFLANLHKGQPVQLPVESVATAPAVHIDGVRLPDGQIHLETLANTSGTPNKYVSLTVPVPKGNSLVVYVRNGTTQGVGVFPSLSEETSWRNNQNQISNPLYNQPKYSPKSGQEILILNQVTQDAVDLVIIQGDKQGDNPDFQAYYANSKAEAEKIGKEIAQANKLDYNKVKFEKDDYTQTNKNDPHFM